MQVEYIKTEWIFWKAEEFNIILDVIVDINLSFYLVIVFNVYSTCVQYFLLTL